MRPSAVWSDWSCRVRVTLDDGTDDDVATATQVVRLLMDRVSVSASRFREDSDLSRVNALAGALIPVGPLTVQLVEVAVQAALRSAGAVDPTVGAHLLDAGYVDDIEMVRQRTHTGSNTVGRRSDWRSVAIDRDLGRIGVPSGTRLDLGATAKAWATDEAARLVHARCGRAALVEIGGDLATAGTPSSPWRIDVAEEFGAPTHRIDLTHGGLATSSVITRRWTSTRGDEHHIIDPWTSRPVVGELRTATVWASTAVEANTWSTAALVWSTDAAARLTDAGVDARLVDHSGRMTPIGAWPEDERSVA